MTAQDTEQNQLPVTQIWREAYGFVFSVPLRVLLTASLPLGLYALASSWIQVQFLNDAAAEVDCGRLGPKWLRRIMLGSC